MQGFLVKDGKKLTLDAPAVGVPGGSDYLSSGGKEVHFTLDFSQAKVLESQAKMGRGKRIEIPARPLAPGQPALQRTLAVEAYDDLPNMVLSTLEYRNTGNSDFKIDDVVTQSHRFDATLADPKAPPYDMWSFHGSSREWGEDGDRAAQVGMGQRGHGGSPPRLPDRRGSTRPQATLGLML